MLDLAMDIPMLLDTTTLARGLLMLSPRPRLMLILLFFMVPMDMPMDILDTMDTTLARGLPMLSLRPRLIPPSCTPPMDMVFLMLDMLDMLDMAMLPLTLMAMLATHMPGENKLMMS